jgi:YfiH family protein
MAVEVIQSGVLRTVAHGFLGRKGGISTGIYAGLNVGLGSEDTRESVIENRLLGVQSVLPGAMLARVHQFHSADVVQVDNAISQDDPPRGDAMVTDQPNVLLGIVTADCVPVLFADTEAGVIGAAHAGWKGAINGVLENTIAAMEKLGAQASRIAAPLAPALRKKAMKWMKDFSVTSSRRPRKMNDTLQMVKQAIINLILKAMSRRDWRRRVSGRSHV